MPRKQIVLACLCALSIALAGCSRQQSDWQKTREANSAEAYEQFLKKYPTGEFTAQAQSRLKELSDVRDWQKARDADTPEAYQAYLNEYPDGQSAAEARNRIENFTMAQTPAGTAAPGDTSPDGVPPGAPPPSANAESGAAAAPPPGVRKSAHDSAGGVARFGCLCRAARRIPLRQRCGEETLGALAEGVPASARGLILQGSAEKNAERYAVPAASRGRERKSGTTHLQGSQSQVAGLRHRSSRAHLAGPRGSRLT